MKNAFVALLALGMLGGCQTCDSDRTVRYVDEFDLTGAVSGYGATTRARKSVAGNPLKLNGKVYARGFGDHPESALAFTADGKVLAFEATVGLDDDSMEAAKGSYGKPTGEFKVWADGKVVWRSGFMKPGDEPKAVLVDLTGAKEIVLESTSGGEWTACNAVHADWADARFICAGDAKLRRLTDPSRTAQLGIQTPKEKDEPQFNGADIWGVRPGRPVIFRVPVSGLRPMVFTAKNLPDGVTLDAKGVLRGTAPATKGDYDIEVTAKNAKGEAKRTIRLAVGDTITLTPPMGWNSWNTLCFRLTQKDAMAAAKALEESGLGDHGWAYVNLDDYWEMNNDRKPGDEVYRPELVGPARDANGKILPNPTFPNMKELTDYIHSFGFKAGLYSSPGPRTCGGCEGSYGHELADAESWADWGFDYVKYDWCSYHDIFKKEKGTWPWVRETWSDPKLREAFIKPYAKMNECLKKQNRDIVFSFCQYGMAHVEEWARANGANCWRSWDDLKDAWVWMQGAIESRIGGEYWKWCGAGCWADPDMLIVGQQYSFGGDHETYLTPNEQYTHVSIWAMVGSPLLIGCDLTKMSDFTRNLLANDEVIAISQDRLGKVAKRIRHTDAESVWVRPLANGDLAVALLNRSPLSREIKVTFDELGLRGAHFLRDCWTGTCEGKHGGYYAATVLPHATKLIRIRANDCPKCDDRAALRFSTAFSSGMVLQRDTESPVWGAAEAGARVTVAIRDAAGKTVATRTATADATGRWQVKTPRIAAGGPYALEAKSDGAATTLADVLFGDVWLCAGQSNMEFGNGWGKSVGIEDVVAQEHPNIRLMAVDRLISGAPKREFPVRREWRPLTAAETNRFSSVGLFFGTQLDAYLGGKVPLGLVHVNWGGTIVEAWFGADELLRSKVGTARMRAAVKSAAEHGANWEMGGRARFAEDIRTFEATYDPYLETPAAKGPSALDFDVSGWKTAVLPEMMEKHLGSDFDGVVWYVRDFELAAASAGELDLPPVDDYDAVYLNGVKIGEGEGWNTPRHYAIPAGVLRKGRNRLVVRADDPALGGGFNAGPKSRFALKAGAQEIPLAGAWRYAAFRQSGCRPIDYDHLQHPSTFALAYNAMIAPLFPMAVKGAIWYQGCSNALPGFFWDGEQPGDGARYYMDFFKLLKSDWRRHFTRAAGDDKAMAFYLVEIAPFNKTNAEPVESDWAVVCDAQRRLGETEEGRTDPHEVTGTVFIGDVGEKNDIHPRDKRTVGRRLARLAANRSYGRKDLIPTGPTPVAVRAEGGRVLVRFANAGRGLKANDGKPLREFELAGADGKFVGVKASVVGTDTVALEIPAGLKPARVRHAWDDCPELNLVNAEGDPATVFEENVR